MTIDIACAEHGFTTNCHHNQREIVMKDNIYDDEAPDYWWDSRVMKWCAYADELV